MTYQEAVKNGEKVLNLANISDAKVDAWMLFEMACKVDRNFYYLHMDEDITAEQQKEYEIALKKRAEHIPLQYITGEQEFMGLKFKVNSNVLIPRQDTEVLVEEALKRIQPGMRVLDMCTGSGCIAVSIAKNVPHIEMHAVDISKQALNVAKDNAKLNEVSVEFERSDLGKDRQPLPKEIKDDARKCRKRREREDGEPDFDHPFPSVFIDHCRVSVCMNGRYSLTGLFTGVLLVNYL